MKIIKSQIGSLCLTCSSVYFDAKAHKDKDLIPKVRHCLIHNRKQNPRHDFPALINRKAKIPQGGIENVKAR